MLKKRLGLSRLGVVFIALALILAMVGACGGDDDDDSPVVKATETDKTTTTGIPVTTEEPTTTAALGNLLTIDSPLGELLDNPDTYAILEEILPTQIMNNPNIGAVRGFSLVKLAPMSEDFTDEMLMAISDKLKELGAYSTAVAFTPATKATSKLTGDPVKIAMVCPWSGPSGVVGLMAEQVAEVVKAVVEERGGILGGRPVEFENYDTEGEVARAQSAWTKLAGDSNVLAGILGGASSGEMIASTIASSEMGIPFFTIAVDRDLPEYPYAVRSGNVLTPQKVSVCVDFVLDNFDPDTAAYLGENMSDMREGIDSAKDALEDAGVETVFEEYINAGTTDLTSALTKIKQANPDVLIIDSTGATVYQNMYKQIADLGGWDGIEVMSLGSVAGTKGAMVQPGAQGTYFWAMWIPGLPYPGAKMFEQAWEEVHGSLDPEPPHVMVYLCMMSAVEAIDQANSADRDDIADLARSGTFQWESPVGLFQVGEDGENNITGIVALIKDGEAVPATP